jgi:hypothetical protein
MYFIMRIGKGMCRRNECELAFSDIQLSNLDEILKGNIRKGKRKIKSVSTIKLNLRKLSNEPLIDLPDGVYVNDISFPFL